jgi:predicted transcriptional regulator
VNHVLARFFQNSPNALAVALLDDVPLRDADREQIRALLERKAKGHA